MKTEQEAVNVLLIIEDLQISSDSKATKCISSWLEGQTEAEIKNNDLYLKYKAQMVDEFGSPTYEGVGPRHKNIDFYPQNKVIEYGSALDLACWERNGHTIFIMMTAHDADTLRQLVVSVAKNSKN